MSICIYLGDVISLIKATSLTHAHIVVYDVLRSRPHLWKESLMQCDGEKISNCSCTPVVLSLGGLVAFYKASGAKGQLVEY